MNDSEKTLVERNENWIKSSKSQIEEYKKLIEKESKCINDLARWNREIKGRV